MIMSPEILACNTNYHFSFFNCRREKNICGMYAFFQNAYGVTAFELVLLFISGRDYHP